MKIGIVGMGLIGGSLAKALAGKTEHEMYGLNRSEQVLEHAESDGVIVGRLTDAALPQMDVIFICLHPEASLAFVRERQGLFSSGQIVTDVAGVKMSVVREMEKLFLGTGVAYIGSHPMAGREHSGYAYSSAGLFEGRSLILTPTEHTDKKALAVLEGLAVQIGFSKIVRSTPKKHDEIIAYTSQLAHIISNAYVKSPTLSQRDGFTAGSFQDLTRVAKLDAELWTDLFLKNREPLLKEIDGILKEIERYRTAIASDDERTLRKLLLEGAALKIKSMEENPSEPN